MSRLLRFRRYLDFSKIHYGGQDYIAINCLIGLSKDPALIHVGMAGALSQLLTGIPETEFKYLLSKKFSIKEISEFVEMLDKLKFLESEQIEEEISELKKSYVSLEAREPWLEGRSFPATKAARVQLINDLLNQVDSRGQIETDVIILPHIDYPRGWQVYAETVKSLKILEKKRFAVLIGTDHKGGSNLVSLCNKPYQLDGFKLEVDRQGINFLTQKAGDWILEDMIHHKTEHSLEITLPFLECILPKNIQTIPILVGAVENHRTYDELISNSQFKQFSSALAEYVSDKLTDTLFVLGIDFSHLGKSFGDPFEISDELLDRTQEYDSKLKASFEENTSKETFDRFVAENLRQKVCGFSSMILLREVLDKLSVKLEPLVERYRQAVNRSQECVVTFWGSGYRLVR